MRNVKAFKRIRDKIVDGIVLVVETAGFRRSIAESVWSSGGDYDRPG
jgi:hypothetical protein